MDDGYGINCTQLNYSPYWLSIVNLTVAEIDSSNDQDAMAAIQEATGIKGITREDKEKGHVMLFNLKGLPLLMTT